MSSRASPRLLCCLAAASEEALLRHDGSHGSLRKDKIFSFFV